MVKKMAVPSIVPLYHVKRRMLTIEHYRNIAWLRFGSLLDFSRPRMALSDVSRQLNLKVTTVGEVISRCRRHQEEGLDYLAPKPKPNFKAGTLPLSDSWEHDHWLAEPRQLQKWAHMTLGERAAKIEKKWGCKCYPLKLAKFYKRLGICRRASYKCYHANVERAPELARRRRQFALKLQRYLTTDREVFYQDESS